MASVVKTKIQNHIQKRLDKHIEKHGHKRVHKFLHHINNFQYSLIHIGELMAIICIGRSSVLFASYNTSYETYHRKSVSEANIYLQDAIKIGKPTTDNIISTRSMDSSVNNTFAAGYCTYGAARISPEFFPYSEDKTSQQRTWGGNAIDRCENANDTGFDIGSVAKKGALVVYNPGNGISSLGHVGKVMYINAKNQYMIVRDMNRLTKNIMADHRENINTANIKCFIYPKNIDNDKNENVVDGSSNIGDNQTQNNQNTENTKDTTNNSNTTEESKDPINNNTTDSNKNPEKETNETKEPSHNSANREPENTNGVILENLTNTKEIEINTDSISDIAKHFLDQYKLTISMTSKDYPGIGDTIKITINIKDKTNNAYFNGILPFNIKLISSNNNISPLMTSIQLVQNTNNEIIIHPKKPGTSTILISLDDDTIARIPLTIID